MRQGLLGPGYTLTSFGCPPGETLRHHHVGTAGRRRPGSGSGRAEFPAASRRWACRRARGMARFCSPRMTLRARCTSIRRPMSSMSCRHGLSLYRPISARAVAPSSNGCGQLFVYRARPIAALLTPPENPTNWCGSITPTTTRSSRDAAGPAVDPDGRAPAGLAQIREPFGVVRVVARHGVAPQHGWRHNLSKLNRGAWRGRVAGGDDRGGCRRAARRRARAGGSAGAAGSGGAPAACGGRRWRWPPPAG